MPLAPSANAAASAWCSSESITDAAAIARFQSLYTSIANWIAANGVIAPGIPVATTGTAVAQTGATTAPGTIS